MAVETERDTGPPASGRLIPRTRQRHELTVVAVSRAGTETVLARKGLVAPAALEQWRSLYLQRHGERSTPFYLIPALSAIGLGGANELDTTYTEYLSPTFRVGMRVPILYLRTTLGAAHDWVFDPNWNIEKRCGERRIAEDSLSMTMSYAIEHKLPVLFTLNGGIWADAGCDVPDWDVNDHLEQDVANCQWNERNEAMLDEFVKHLPGSADAPELSRSLTSNAFAMQNRPYERCIPQATAPLAMA